MHLDEQAKLLIALAGIFALGIGAQWVAWRVRLPSILLLLTMGFLVGPISEVISPSGTRLIDPTEMLGPLLFPIVSLSVAIILFEGSLSLRLKELRSIGKPLFRLLTVGVAITWGLCALAAHYCLELGWFISVLLGAILTVTGPTVVGPMLRHIRPIGTVGPIARWEGIVVDPIGAVLAVLVFEARHIEAFNIATLHALAALGKTILIGGGIGAAAAILIAFLLRRHWIPDYLESLVTMMIVVVTFVLSNILQEEAGLVTVTVMGIWLANSSKVNIKHILEFKENLSVLLISSLFILLSARLDLSQFGELSWRGPLFVVIVILIVRPASVFASTAGSELNHREKLFLSFLAPRGIVAAAVASIFALELQESGKGLDSATFLVIVGTVLTYGLASAPLARRLGLSTPNPQGLVIAGANAFARSVAHALKDAGFTVLLVDSNHYYIRTARMEGLNTCQADILSDHALEELNLGGIGRFLAVTPNDQVNSLSAIHFSELFGNSGVYQLPPIAQEGQRKGQSGQMIFGRLLFSPQANYWELQRRIELGSTIKATKLTDEFNLAAFNERYQHTALPLFLIDEAGKRLTIYSTNPETSPKSGQTLIALVDKPVEKSTEASNETPSIP